MSLSLFVELLHTCAYLATACLASHVAQQCLRMFSNRLTLRHYRSRGDIQVVNEHESARGSSMYSSIQ